MEAMWVVSCLFKNTQEKKILFSHRDIKNLFATPTAANGLQIHTGRGSAALNQSSQHRQPVWHKESYRMMGHTQFPCCKTDGWAMCTPTQSSSADFLQHRSASHAPQAFPERPTFCVSGGVREHHTHAQRRRGTYGTDSPMSSAAAARIGAGEWQEPQDGTICALLTSPLATQIAGSPGFVLASQNPSTAAARSSNNLLWKHAFLQKQEASSSSWHFLSLLGMEIKWNWSKISLNNLIGCTNTELSAEWGSTATKLLTEAGTPCMSISVLGAPGSPALCSRHSSSYRCGGQSPPALQRHMTTECFLMHEYRHTAYAQVTIKKK